MRKLYQVIEEDTDTKQCHERDEVDVEFALHALVHCDGVAFE